MHATIEEQYYLIAQRKLVYQCQGKIVYFVVVLCIHLGIKCFLYTRSQSCTMNASPKCKWGTCVYRI